MSWDALASELEAWQRSGRSASLWWRDDDAGAPSSALARLIDLAAENGVPVCLAAVPAESGTEFVDLVEPHPPIMVAVHGLAHRNHAPPGARKAEFGAHRPLPDMIGEIEAASAKIAGLFGSRALPVFVPPWNRLAPALVTHLPGAGLRGLSTLKARASAEPAPGLRQVNAHVDVIDWRGTRGFRGEEASLADVIAHLRARRTGAADPDEPTGLLTHHRVLDGPAWGFLARFLGQVRARNGACWPSLRKIFNLVE